MSYKQEFYIGTHVVTYDGKEHAQKLAVPINTLANKKHKSMLNKLECLEFKNSQSNLFDQKSKGVFSKINLDQSEDLRTK